MLHELHVAQSFLRTWRSTVQKNIPQLLWEPRISAKTCQTLDLVLGQINPIYILTACSRRSFEYYFPI